MPLHEEEGEAAKCKAQKPFDFDDFESLAILDNRVLIEIHPTPWILQGGAYPGELWRQAFGGAMV